MAEKLDEKEITTTEEKGIISEQEFFTKLEQVQSGLENGKGVKV